MAVLLRDPKNMMDLGVPKTKDTQTDRGETKDWEQPRPLRGHGLVQYDIIPYNKYYTG